MSKEKQGVESDATAKPNQRLAMLKTQDSTIPDFVRVEKNIAAFGFFTPSSKRAKNTPPKVITFTQIIDDSRVEAEVKIIGHIELGMPTTADQDKYLAFQKIIERAKLEKGKIENPITFTTAELLRLLGKTDAGINYKEVQEWLEIMKVTTIKSRGAIWLAGKKRTTSDIFSIFDRAKSIGDELDDGTVAEQNYVWLSAWYLENLNNYYLLPIDFETYKLLKHNISKALIPLLQIWLYASKEVGRFEKRYSEICQTLNITEYKHLSDIKRFFGNSLDELVTHRYLESWEIEKTADKKDFKVIFHHGLKFYADRAKTKRLRKTKQALTSLQNQPKAVNPKPGPKNGPTPPHFAPGKQSDTEPATHIELSLDTVADESREVVRQLHVEYQIGLAKAIELATKHLAEATRQLEAYPFRNITPSNKAGFLIEAIEKAYSVPEEYLSHLSEKAFQEQRARRQAKIDACDICDISGWRNVKSDYDKVFGSMRECTHDPAIESQIEEHII